jgi:hypothetical protein
VKKMAGNSGVRRSKVGSQRKSWYTAVQVDG